MSEACSPQPHRLTLGSPSPTDLMGIDRVQSTLSRNVPNEASERVLWRLSTSSCELEAEGLTDVEALDNLRRQVLEVSRQNGFIEHAIMEMELPGTCVVPEEEFKDEPEGFAQNDVPGWRHVLTRPTKAWMDRYVQFTGIASPSHAKEIIETVLSAAPTLQTISDQSLEVGILPGPEPVVSLSWLKSQLPIFQKSAEEAPGKGMNPERDQYTAEFIQYLIMKIEGTLTERPQNLHHEAEPLPAGTASSDGQPTDVDQFDTLRHALEALEAQHEALWEGMIELADYLGIDPKQVRSASGKPFTLFIEHIERKLEGLVVPLAQMCTWFQMAAQDAGWGPDIPSKSPAFTALKQARALLNETMERLADKRVALIQPVETSAQTGVGVADE